MPNRLKTLLNSKLAELKEARESPRLHLSNYFDDLKRKVDINFNSKIFSYQSQQENEVESDKASIITAGYESIIEKIKEYEDECMTRHVTLFSESLKKTIDDSIRDIEQKLMNYVEENKEDEDDETSDDEDEEVKDESFYSDSDYAKEYDFGYLEYNDEGDYVYFR